MACLVVVVSFAPDVGWVVIVCLAVLWLAPPGAMLATRHVRTSLRLRANIPAVVLEHRLHGGLDLARDDAARQLRSIGVAPTDVVERTGMSLAALIESPSVHVFHGIRAGASHRPVLAHAVVAGRALVLVEPVAWPPGTYELDPSGRVRCDGRYIGQSVADLRAAVQHWRAALPRSHRVSAVIAVVRTDAGRYTLPAPSADLVWAEADDLLSVVRNHLPRRPAVSTHAIAALTAAIVPG